MNIAIAHDRRVAHRRAGRIRSTTECGPTSAASSISSRGAGPSFGYRRFGAPARRVHTCYCALRRAGSAGATGRAPCMPSMLRCAMKRTTRQVAPRRCTVASLRRCNDRVPFAGIRCDIPVSRDAGDYRRLKNTARFLHAISFRIVGNEQYPSCRKVVFATD